MGFEERLFAFFISALMVASTAQAQDAKAYQISLDFSYPGRQDHLAAVSVDAKRNAAIQKSCGNGGSSKCIDDAAYLAKKNVTDPQVLKNNFLLDFEQSIPQGSTLRLDMTGHGVMGTDGKWYFQLPHNENLPDSLFSGNTPAKEGDPTQGGLLVNKKAMTPLKVNTSDPAFKGHFVSMDEIGNVLKRRGVKNVYGVVASCYSGGAACSMPSLEENGIHASFLAGAPQDRTMTGYDKSGSLMSDFMNQVRKHPEKYDLNGDKRITWDEVVRASEEFKRTEWNSRTSAKGNAVKQDVGFQPTPVATKQVSPELAKQVIFDFSHGSTVDERTIPNATHFK